MAAQKCDAPKLKDLVYELKGVDFHALGVQLEVPGHALTDTDRNHQHDVGRKLSEMLQYWLDNDGCCSWRKIVEGLERVGGYGKIIKTIRSKYMNEQIPPPPQREVDTDSPDPRIDNGRREQVTQPAHQPPPREPATDRRLNDKDHRELLTQLGTHAAQWREIGSQLGFLPGELDIIQATPMLLIQGPSGYLSEMLSKWLQWAPKDGRGSEDFARLSALKRATSAAGLGRTAHDLTLSS